MAIARVTVWSSGQILTASALNGEYDNILNNVLLAPTAALTTNQIPYGDTLNNTVKGSANLTYNGTTFSTPRANINGEVTPTAFTDTAIQTAINTVNTAGGGTVVLAPGSYIKSGGTWATITMKDHVRLLGPLGPLGERTGQTGKGAVLLNNDAVNFFFLFIIHMCLQV